MELIRGHDLKQKEKRTINLKEKKKKKLINLFDRNQAFVTSQTTYSSSWFCKKKRKLAAQK